jgi:drug/metabolite transporter (DMT)-like permease
MKERLLGLVMLLAGAALSYWCVYEPLEAADRQEAKVSVSLKGAILCPVAVVMGAAYLILGKRATDVFGTREHPSPAAWVSAVLLVLVGVGLYFYLKMALEAKGYQF